VVLTLVSLQREFALTRSLKQAERSQTTTNSQRVQQSLNLRSVNFTLWRTLVEKLAGNLARQREEKMKDPMKTILPLMAFSAMCPMPGFKQRIYEEKKPKNCSLPGCDNKTFHNGGYCCAEHCKKHKEARKKELAEPANSSTNTPQGEIKTSPSAA